MGRFKILQFNMQFGQSWNEAAPDHAAVDLDLTIAEIRSHDAHVVLLQEVEQALPGGAQAQPPPNYTRLRAELGGYDGFFSYPKADPRELPFGIGLAILSRTPLRETFRRDLPSPPIEFEFEGVKRTPTDRLMIGATIEVAGRTLRVLNTHLLAFYMLNSSSAKHPKQRRLVLEQLRKSQGPTVLGGDFNVSGHQSLARQFAGAGFHTVQDSEATWRRRPYVLDHIFYNESLTPVHHAVQPTPASDHHLLVAEFAFADEAQSGAKA